MDFQILGPVEAFAEGQSLPITGRRQCALLAYLLLHANEVVAGDRLLDELWAEAPRGGLAALQTQVSRLRRIVGDRIVTSGSGYAVRVEPGELDLERFRLLLAEAGATADPAARSRLLRGADALWHGAPLTGLDVPFAAGEVAALEELRLAALEDRVAADLELPSNGELVSELYALVARHPLRERLRGQLILALYRAGRQTEALEAYRETRRMLTEELGLEPTPALRELERAILRHDPALARVAPVPMEAPAGFARKARRKGPLVAGGLVLLGSAAIGAVGLTSGGGGTPRALRTQTVQTVRVVTEPVVQTVPVTAKHHARSHPRRHPATTPIVKRNIVHPVKRSTAPSTPARTIPTRTNPTTTKKSTTATATTPSRKPTKPPPKPVTISDNFAGTQIDGTIWYEIESGTGWTLAQDDGYVEFAFSPTATAGGAYNQFGGHLGSQCKFPGDFDARVDYSLPQWPLGNGMTVNLWAFVTNASTTNAGWAVWRQSSPQWGEQYGSYTGPDSSAGVSVDDRSGTLRLVRSGGLLRAYFLHKGNWQSLTAARNDGLATIAIGANGSSAAAFGGQPVVVDFRNFSVTGNDPVCPAGSQPTP
jgi:DNA-binding SARP family transcriptional activator